MVRSYLLELGITRWKVKIKMFSLIIYCLISIHLHGNISKISFLLIFFEDEYCNFLFTGKIAWSLFWMLNCNLRRNEFNGSEIVKNSVTIMKMEGYIPL